MNGRSGRIGGALLGAFFALAGCDAVLGIHEPLGYDWDGGVSQSTSSSGTSSSASSSQNGSSYMNPLTNGDGATPPPIDAGNVQHWANWPMPNPMSAGLPHPQVYDTATAGIVKDTVTGLEWQAAIDGVTRSWNDAVAHCASMPDSGGGWRLPSRIELFSILDYSTAPAISTTSFGALPITDSGSFIFWSASLKAGDNTQAWALDFGSSVDLVFPKATTAALLVRCVRGGS
jgi:hypothetical protein